MRTKGKKITIEYDYINWFNDTKSGKMNIKLAVKYLEHGADMKADLKMALAMVTLPPGSPQRERIRNTLAKLEGK